MGVSIKFYRYWISESHFSINPNFFEKMGSTMKIEPKLFQTIRKIGNKYEVVLTVKIEKKNDSPFEIALSINGIFECEKPSCETDQIKTIKGLSAQTLFPFLRQAVATITGMANIPAYILPLINVNAFIEEDSGDK